MSIIKKLTATPSRSLRVDSDNSYRRNQTMKSSIAKDMGGDLCILNPKLAEKCKNTTASPLFYEELLKSGITKQDALRLNKSLLEFPMEKLAMYLGVASRTFSRLQVQDLLPERASEIIISVIRANQEAIRVLGSPEKAKRWLSKPNGDLQGEPPLILLRDRFGAEEVQNTLIRIEYAMYA